MGMFRGEADAIYNGAKEPWVVNGHKKDIDLVVGVDANGKEVLVRRIHKVFYFMDCEGKDMRKVSRDEAGEAMHRGEIRVGMLTNPRRR